MTEFVVAAHLNWTKEDGSMVVKLQAKLTGAKLLHKPMSY